MAQNHISVCMVVKNEAQLIGLSIESIRPIAHEVIVVDTGSRDRTRTIAKNLGAVVIRYEWDGSLGRARNAYMKAATGNWILILDGDETIAAKDLPKIRKLVKTSGMIGYSLAIRNYTDHHDLMWRWYPNDGRYPKEERLSACAGWAQTQPLRLFRNFADLKYVEGTSVHTTPLASLKKHGRIEKCDEVVIHHFQYLKGFSRFLTSKQRKRLEGEMNHAKLFPKEPWTYLNIAKTLFAMQRDDEAIKHLTRAVKLNDKFHDAFQLWGMIDFQNGRLASAEQRLRRAIAVNSQSADAWAILGMVLIEANRVREAKQALHRAIQIHPNHLLANNSLGVLYADAGKYDLARNQYRKTLKLHPRFTPAIHNLAKLSGPTE